MTRRFRLVLLGAGLIILAAVGLSNWWVLSANADRLVDSLAELPDSEVALVLGTSARMRDGGPNLHFESRIDAATALFQAGKVKHLLVSGDNRTHGYNEPLMMRAALLKRGIPAAAITCDFAGLRTLDSVVRAKEIFGLHRCVIISQRYHNSRALEIARAHGLEAWAWCAPEVAFRHSFRTELREVIARCVVLLDLHVLHRHPRFLGKPEPIMGSSIRQSPE